MADIPMCPRCGGPIPSAEYAGEYPGALSRVDNQTEICSQCGTDEAMLQMSQIHLGRSRMLTFEGWKSPPVVGGNFGASQMIHRKP